MSQQEDTLVSKMKTFVINMALAAGLCVCVQTSGCDDQEQSGSVSCFDEFSRGGTSAEVVAYNIYSGELLCDVTLTLVPSPGWVGKPTLKPGDYYTIGDVCKVKNFDSQSCSTFTQEPKGGGLTPEGGAYDLTVTHAGYLPATFDALALANDQCGVGLYFWHIFVGLTPK